MATVDMAFPGVGAAEAFHRRELGLGVLLDLQRTLEEVGMILPEPVDLMLFGGGAEETRGLTGTCRPASAMICLQCSRSNPHSISGYQ